MNRFLMVAAVILLLVLLFPIMFFSGSMPTSRYTDWKDFRQQFVSGVVDNQTQHPIRVISHMVYSSEEKLVMPGFTSEKSGMHDVDAFWLEHATFWNDRLYEQGQVFRMCDFARVTVVANGPNDTIQPHWTLKLCALKDEFFPKAGHAIGVFGTEAEAFALSDKARRVLDGQHVR